MKAFGSMQPHGPRSFSFICSVELWEYFIKSVWYYWFSPSKYLLFILCLWWQRRDGNGTLLETIFFRTNSQMRRKVHAPQPTCSDTSGVGSASIFAIPTRQSSQSSLFYTFQYFFKHLMYLFVPFSGRKGFGTRLNLLNW